MASGGRRNRSGPQADPNSARSDLRRFTLAALPAAGFDGVVPEFPLPDASVRELEVWAECWATPQACAWSMEPWRWPVVAEFCRLKTVVEAEPAKSASLVNQLHRYRDQLGLTPAGLKDNGWAIGPDEVAAKREERATTDAVPQRRLRAVHGD